MLGTATKGWADFRQACRKLRAAAEHAARLALLRKEALRTGSDTLPSAAELDAAVWRVSVLTNAVHKRIKALRAAYLACVDRRAARGEWERSRIVRMFHAAISPVIVFRGEEAVLADVLLYDPAADVHAPPAGPPPRLAADPADADLAADPVR